MTNATDLKQAQEEVERLKQELQRKNEEVNYLRTQLDEVASLKKHLKKFTKKHLNKVDSKIENSLQSSRHFIPPEVRPDDALEHLRQLDAAAYDAYTESRLSAPALRVYRKAKRLLKRGRV